MSDLEGNDLNTKKRRDLFIFETEILHAGETPYVFLQATFKMTLIK